VEGSVGKEERRSASVDSRRANRSIRTNDVGEYVSTAGAATATNEPDVESLRLQPRAASVDEEPKQKATIGKEGRTFS